MEVVYDDTSSAAFVFCYQLVSLNDGAVLVIALFCALGLDNSIPVVFIGIKQILVPTCASQWLGCAWGSEVRCSYCGMEQNRMKCGMRMRCWEVPVRPTRQGSCFMRKCSNVSHPPPTLTITLSLNTFMYCYRRV